MKIRLTGTRAEINEIRDANELARPLEDTAMTDPADVDLFGNPIDNPGGGHPVGTPGTRVLTNDMDLVQSILADITDEKTPPLHQDDGDNGLVRRCGKHDPETEETVSVVRQLVAARYLTTTRHGCPTPGHGPVITTTPTGRAAVCRWRAYRRPPSWDATGISGTTNVRH